MITETAAHDGMEVNWEYGFPEFLEADKLEERGTPVDYNQPPKSCYALYPISDG